MRYTCVKGWLNKPQFCKEVQTNVFLCVADLIYVELLILQKIIQNFLQIHGIMLWVSKPENLFTSKCWLYRLYIAYI